MGTNNKKSVALISITFLVLSAVLLFFISQHSSKADKNSDGHAKATNSDNLNKASEQDNGVVSTASAKTIASEWQWQEINKNRSTTGSTDVLPFTPQSVHDALYAVKLDENGDIILDHDALISLDETLERIYNRLDGESLAILRDLITDALPGKAGEQTAKLVEDYQQFLQAKEAFSQANEQPAYSSGEQTVAAIESDKLLYSELQQLREVHLGSDVAKSLFSISDANAEFMFESLKLEADQSLTADQRAAKYQEIQERLQQQTANQ